MINKDKFPLYGYICSAVAILFFILHFLYLIDKCPFDISTVIRVSFIQVILAILAMYFGCCSETKKAKISIISGFIVILLVILYYAFIIHPCIS
jgi:hypothetical protein